MESNLMVNSFDDLSVEHVKTNLGYLAIRHYVGPKRSSNTLVFWHSLSLSSKMWSNQFLALKEDFSMIFIDGPGHGFSQDLNGQFSLLGCVNSVILILDHCHVSNCIAIGCSWGGMVATLLPVFYPTRCIGSIAMNCTLREATYFEAIQLWCASLYTSFSSSFFNNTKPDWLAKQLSLYLLGSPILARSKEKQKILGDMVNENRSKSLSWSLYSIAKRKGYLSILNQIQSPILFIAGEQDREYTPEQVRVSALAASDQAEFHCIKQSGHISAFDSPEETNKIIFKFLEKHKLIVIEASKKVQFL